MGVFRIIGVDTHGGITHDSFGSGSGNDSISTVGITLDLIS
ncbi:hypothetical protein SDC9_200121 [bioreactor metagenome]|uniref:Uncharacterized protein n=1 Tax=bioreactor metagenome TaxID=1076179 RepID=A0A645IPX1_9ZZZZ